MKTLNYTYECLGPAAFTTICEEAATAGLECTITVTGNTQVGIMHVQYNEAIVDNTIKDFVLSKCTFRANLG